MNPLNSARNFSPKKNAITEDYEITKQVLGLGISGKVVECFNKNTKEKFALKVILKMQGSVSLAWANCMRSITFYRYYRKVRRPEEKSHYIGELVVVDILLISLMFMKINCRAKSAFLLSWSG